MMIIEEKFDSPSQMLWLLGRYAEEIEAEYIVLYNVDKENDVINFEYQELIRSSSGSIEGVKRYVSSHSNIQNLDSEQVKDVINSLNRDFNNIRLFPGKTSITNFK